MDDTTGAASDDQVTPHPQLNETNDENNREALLELLRNWINTDTWNESQEILQAHKEQLLSDDALEALEELHNSLLSDADEEEHESITETIQQHRAILEQARAESIEAAYSELLKPSPLAQALQKLPEELREPIQALIEVKSPAELLEQIAQHPILLTTQATDAIDTLLDELQQAGQEGAVRYIEARYDTLKQVIQDLSKPNPLSEALQKLPDELSEAIQALIAVKSSAELLEQVNKHPILLTQEATTAIDNLLETLGQAGQTEIVEYIEERYKTLKQVIEGPGTTLRPVPDDLAKLLTDWINTDTWNESQEMLKTNAERLLTDEAIAALNGSLMRSAGEDEDTTRTLLQHRALLEQARAESIDAAYAELLNPELHIQTWQSLPDELPNALQAMIEVNNSAELLEQIERYPVLLSSQATTAIDTLLNELRQAGKDGAVRRIEARYDTLKQVIEAERDPLTKALNAFLAADSLVKLHKAVTQYPILLEDEALNRIIGIIAKIEQEGSPIATKGLRLQFNELQRIRKQREMATRSTSQSHEDHHDGYEEHGGVEVSATQGGIAAKEIDTVNQVYIEHYTESSQLNKQWQQPRHQAFSERKSFVGRQDELDMLLKYLDAGENVAITGKVIQAATLQGMAGIGKTYLARKLAIELQDRFSGGAIWIKLGPDVRDKATAQLQLGELASYAFGGQTPGTPLGQLQPEVVAAWLEEIAPGRLLVIFDDVWHQAALSFLDSALPAKAVRLVTTRYANIAETFGGQRITLGRLTLDDGVALLVDRLGSQVEASYRTDLEQLVELLEGHALALDIAAALIKKPSRVQAILKNLKEGLGRGELDRLKISDGEERDTNLEKSLGLSYRMMSTEQKRRFRAMGVFAPETLITPEVAAAIWGIEDLEAAQNALFELEDLALLTEVTESTDLCYQQHGLLRVYAHALLDQEGELTSASWAHAQYYTELVVHTEIADYPLLDQHIPNLLAALHWSAENEPILLSRMLEASFQLLLVRGQSERIEGYLPKAVAAAAENPVRQANLLKSLGDLESRLGNIDQARAHYDAALPL